MLLDIDIVLVKVVVACIVLVVFELSPEWSKSLKTVPLYFEGFLRETLKIYIKLSQQHWPQKYSLDL